MLLDSWAGCREVWGRWCALRGVDLELAWAATHGRRPVETVAQVAPHLDPAAEHLVLRQLLAECRDAFPAFAAARPLLGQLPAGAWAVVTSGQRQTAVSRFASAGLPLPAVLVDGDDVTDGSRRRRATCSSGGCCASTPATASWPRTLPPVCGRARRQR